MTLGDVVDKLHNEHCLAHTGTSEKTDFTTLAVGFEKVNHLDTCIKDFGTNGEVVKFRRRLMDGTEVFAFKRGETVDGIAKHVEQAAFHLITGGNGDWTLKVIDTHTALQAVGTFHGDTTHSVFADVLFYFKNKLGAIGTIHLESRVDGRDDIVVTLKDHIDHRTDYLGYFSIFFTHFSGV